MKSAFLSASAFFLAYHQVPTGQVDFNAENAPELLAQSNLQTVVGKQVPDGLKAKLPDGTPVDLTAYLRSGNKHVVGLTHICPMMIQIDNKADTKAPLNCYKRMHDATMAEGLDSKIVLLIDDDAAGYIKKHPQAKGMHILEAASQNEFDWANLISSNNSVSLKDGKILKRNIGTTRAVYSDIRSFLGITKTSLETLLVDPRNSYFNSPTVGCYIDGKQPKGLMTRMQSLRQGPL